MMDSIGTTLRFMVINGWQLASGEGGVAKSNMSSESCNYLNYNMPVVCLVVIEPYLCLLLSFYMMCGWHICSNANF